MKRDTVILVGNPNTGKSTLFNSLTGGQQTIGNWPGVTVEKHTGISSWPKLAIEFEIIDLPGIYSLVSLEQESAIAETIANQYLHTFKSAQHLIVNVVDATNLERNLYLTMQLLEMKVPLILALNMSDIAKARGITIDLKQLEKALGVPVVAISASKKAGIPELLLTCQRTLQKSKQSLLPSPVSYPSAVTTAWQQLIDTLKIEKDTPSSVQNLEYVALRLLEGDVYFKNQYPHWVSNAYTSQSFIQQQCQEDADILLADSRYQYVHQLCQKVSVCHTQQTHNWTKKIDKIILNRWLGIPIFLVVMYTMFLFAINLGHAFQDFFDIASDTIFVQGVAHIGQYFNWPSWLIALTATGIGKGLNTTLTFIPVIGAMFFFLSCLESSGYMARAAFVMDRCMRALGLPGQSFIPLIVGFGCNVPAILGTRTLENPRDRILTALMTPFMSCSARLAIFAVFVTAFFPKGGQNIVFILYVLGILIAVMTGFILRKSLLQGKPAPLIMELPDYHWPRWYSVLTQAWQRLRAFIWRAGRTIVPVCMVIGFLNALTLHGGLQLNDAHETSLLSELGRVLTPYLAPLGIQADNWPATVGLLTGMLAKEVVIATLNTLYLQVGHLANVEVASAFSLWQGLQDALISIPKNLAALPAALLHPISASAPDSNLHPAAYGLMQERFGSSTAAFSYLIFVLLYVPCVSTITVIAREVNKKWALFSLAWGTLIAYLLATAFYQTATFYAHPQSSAEILISCAIVFSALIILLKWLGARSLTGERKVYATSS